MYFIETCTMLAAILILIRSLHALRKASKNTLKEALLVSKPNNAAQLNIYGGVLLIFAVASPLCALTLGSSTLSWDHPLVIALFVATPVLLAGLYYHEEYIASNPTIPVNLVSRVPILRVFISVFGVVFAFNIV